LAAVRQKIHLSACPNLRGHLYLRHPPLSSWLSGFASTLGPYRYFAVYAFGWVLASGAFIILASFLANRHKPMSRTNRYAGLVTLLAGLSSPFATYIPLNLNHNITLMPFWALSIAASWLAFSRGNLGDWLIFGGVVGLGLWAKYALLLLILPLFALYWLTPEWCKQSAKPGPYLATLICIGIIAPHIADVLVKGSSTLEFAVHTSPASLPERLRWMGEFALDCVLAQIIIVMLAVLAGGRRVLALGWFQSREWRTAPRFELFLNVIAFGPVAIVMLAALGGIKPHVLWVTPFSLGFAAFWGQAAARSRAMLNIRRLFQGFSVTVGLLALSFIGAREIIPSVSRRAHIQDMDGPALAALAERYWAERHSGKIPFLVSLGGARGFQAAASIAFDLPYYVPTLEDGDPAHSPWFDVEALRRRGALIVMAAQPDAGILALGEPVENTETFARPVLRGAGPQTITFGELLGK
jgi:Dolichyl-phosphate-mannose-protein mannosyltransferase